MGDVPRRAVRDRGRADGDGERAVDGEPAPRAVPRGRPRSLPRGAHRARARAPRAVPRADERRVRARGGRRRSTCACGSGGAGRRWRAAAARARSPSPPTRPASCPTGTIAVPRRGARGRAARGRRGPADRAGLPRLRRARSTSSDRRRERDHEADLAERLAERTLALVDIPSASGDEAAILDGSGRRCPDCCSRCTTRRLRAVRSARACAGSDAPLVVLAGPRRHGAPERATCPAPRGPTAVVRAGGRRHEGRPRRDARGAGDRPRRTALGGRPRRRVPVLRPRGAADHGERAAAAVRAVCRRWRRSTSRS